ncbi:thermonuclease family protein [Pirellulaceae bacterium]|jgi:endonuclease YncB( thermonuclease family)|nr:thermonuclease family protein [Pirellulaceae bacterium]
MTTCIKNCNQRWTFYKQNREKKHIDVLLNNATNDNVPWLSFDGQELEAKVVDVYDGDTMTLAIPFNCNVYKRKCRLIDLDTAEIRTKDNKEKSVGIAGRDFVRDLVLGKRVFVKCGKDDKYGRLLASIYLTPDNDKDLSTMIVEAGLGYRYDGKTKKKFEEWYADDGEECCNCPQEEEENIDDDIVKVDPDSVYPPFE